MFENAGSKVIRIIGISADTVESQKKFASKYGLNYTLLADKDMEARKAFGVADSALMGIAARADRRIFSCLGILSSVSPIAERVTFIIDGRGTVRAAEDSSILYWSHSKLLEKWIGILAKEDGHPQQ